MRTGRARQRTFVAQQTDLYRRVLDEGADSGEFRLAAPAEQVEERLLCHARLMTGM
ncbi:hypothetical protein [Streptomyces sp. NPDC058812]|uniref:hypothetical protein n=1 Tax=unclassified Streptomyces TaxID=2593676 RepID=UPI003685B85C